MRLLVVEHEKRLALSLARGLRAERLDTGADDYLTKPFSYVVLRVGEVVSKRKTPRSVPDPPAARS
jgi:CheY-like chemotaxis protein